MSSVGPLVCILYDNKTNKAICGIDEYYNKWIPIVVLSAKSKQHDRIKPSLNEAGFPSKYYAQIKIKKHWVNAVNYVALSSFQFSHGVPDALGNMGNVFNIIQTQQYRMTTVNVDLITKNIRNVIINGTSNNNFAPTGTALNTHIFQSVFDDGKDEHKAQLLTKQQLDEIFEPFSFHQDKNIDKSTKITIINDFMNNFAMQKLKFPPPRDIKQKQLKKWQNKNKNNSELEHNTLIFMGSTRADCNDSKLRKFAFQNKSLSNYPMAYKLTDTPEQTLDEIYTNYDIISHGYKKFEVPHMYTATITNYTLQSGDTVCTMFGMDACTCDLDEFINHNIMKLQIPEKNKMKIIFQKIWRAGLVLNNIYHATKVCHFDIAARNIFLTNTNNGFEYVNNENDIKIRKTAVSLGDWQLSGVDDDLSAELGKLPMFFGARIFCPDDIYGKTKYDMDKIPSFMLSMVLVEAMGGCDAMNKVKEIARNDNINMDIASKMKQILNVFKVEEKNNEFVVDVFCHLSMLLLDSVKFDENKRMSLDKWLLNDLFLFLDIPQNYVKEIESATNYKMNTMDLLLCEKIKTYTLEDFIGRQQEIVDSSLRGVWV